MSITTEEELRKYVSEGWRIYYNRKRDSYYLYSPKDRKFLYVRKSLKDVVKQMYMSQFVKTPTARVDDILLLITGLTALSFCALVLEKEYEKLSSDGRVALHLLNLVIRQLRDVSSRVGRVEQG